MKYIGIDAMSPEEKRQQHKARWEVLCILDPSLEQEPVGLTDQDLDKMLDEMILSSLS